MRAKHKMWRNGRGGHWSHRITWYQDGTSIRLKIDHPEGVINKFYKRPEREAEAQEFWDTFKNQYGNSLVRIERRLSPFGTVSYDAYADGQLVGNYRLRKDAVDAAEARLLNKQEQLKSLAEEIEREIDS